jgi:glucose-6-phosphate 1-dehydrogenase
MSDFHSDALVFFGATGDLAYKKIFPALQAMLKRGYLNIPVIGVAKSGWNLDQFRERARESVAQHGGLDAEAFGKLIGLLRYVDGDYTDPATFEALRKELNGAQRPAHYLAIPPSLFGTVVEQLASTGCSRGARVIVEKPFGHDLASAQELNRTLQHAFPESAIFRIDHYLGKPGQQRGGFPVCQRVHGAVLESKLYRERADHDGGRFRRTGARRFL